MPEISVQEIDSLDREGETAGQKGGSKGADSSLKVVERGVKGVCQKRVQEAAKGRYIGVIHGVLGGCSGRAAAESQTPPARVDAGAWPRVGKHLPCCYLSSQRVQEGVESTRRRSAIGRRGFAAHVQEIGEIHSCVNMWLR
jgi:hypothetical protein